jgi:hypothetical protein
MTSLGSANPTKGKPFPSIKDSAKGVGTAKAEPTLIGRKDIPHEVWTVEECAAVRGEPLTDIKNRVMFAPSTDDDLSRSIRAHELMHSKISPTPEQFAKFIERGFASQKAMTVVEELRVNTLCKKVGIPVDKFLADGSELVTGERLAKANDWAGAVAMTIACTGTNGLKPFLNGIRRGNREWGKELLSVSKKAAAEMKKANKYGRLGRTTSMEDEGLSPVGFLETERIAEWVDRVAEFPPDPPPPPSPAGASSIKDSANGKDGDEEAGRGGHDNTSDYSDDANRSGNPQPRDINPCRIPSEAPRWADLRVERVTMSKILHGAIGKKRIATNMGRRPRRMHRLMTDPAKRVFDKKIRGNGGMVIIDGSGSMAFSHEQIAEIIGHSPGCTVAIYSDRNKLNGTNMWVVADKGKMVETLEGCDYGYGNGVDYPAIVWGVENQKHKNAPLVWITDGGVCGFRDSFSQILSMQCLNYAMKNGYIIVPNIEVALEQLAKISRGGKATSVYPQQFKQVWKNAMGTKLQ